MKHRFGILEYTTNQLQQLYKAGVISPFILRNAEIKEKIQGMPGKLSTKVKHTAAITGLSIRTIYRIIKN